MYNGMVSSLRPDVSIQMKNAADRLKAARLLLDAVSVEKFYEEYKANFGKMLDAMGKVE